MLVMLSVIEASICFFRSFTSFRMTASLFCGLYSVFNYMVFSKLCKFICYLLVTDGKYESFVVRTWYFCRFYVLNSTYVICSEMVDMSSENWQLGQFSSKCYRKESCSVYKSASQTFLKTFVVARSWCDIEIPENKYLVDFSSISFLVGLKISDKAFELGISHVKMCIGIR